MQAVRAAFSRTARTTRPAESSVRTTSSGISCSSTTTTTPTSWTHAVRVERVWELEFLTELFPALGRTTEVQQETVSYHLDYDGGTRWDLMEESLLATTRRELNRLVAKYAPVSS